MRNLFSVEFIGLGGFFSLVFDGNPAMIVNECAENIAIAGKIKNSQKSSLISKEKTSKVQMSPFKMSPFRAS